MKNRVLLLAAAAALAMPGLAKIPGGQTVVAAPSAPQGVAGTQAPAGGIGALLGDMLRHGGGGGRGGRPKYKKQRGPGHLTAKRIKRKVRNRLRAKGQFRGAVR